MVNKVYAFQFENLRFFIAFPLQSVETGTEFLVFVSPAKPKRGKCIAFPASSLSSSSAAA